MSLWSADQPTKQDHFQEVDCYDPKCTGINEETEGVNDNKWSFSPAKMSLPTNFTWSILEFFVLNKNTRY